MVNTKAKVVVYGVNGYTGKLIAESLAARGIPFVAAGRNEQKIIDSLKIVAERMGVESIDAEVRTAQHSVEGLSELFADTDVVINVTGPFAQIGETVVQAALQAGCHYLDTTGEQDFMIDMRDRYSDAYAEKGLLLSPACAYMWTLGALAAEVCLEKEGIDSLDINYVSENGVPSVASTRSFLRMLAAPHYFLRENELREWELAKLIDTKVPNYNDIFKGSPWGGAAEPVWYQHDPRVQNCKVMVCADNAAMELVAGAVETILEQSEGQPDEMREATANMIGDTITPIEPEKEDPLVHRNIISCEARGTINHARCVIVMHSPYVVTAELLAEGISHLLNNTCEVTGFEPITKLCGHRDLLGMLAAKKFLTVYES